MKKFATIIAILFLVLCSLSACGKGTYEDGYEDGYDAGYEVGCERGYDIGYDDGFDEGYNEGYDEGYYEGFDNNDGYEVGYADGENDGYYAGATYTCLFFGDVDRAFQSANNGCAWHAFIDAYDQYISNIFDDDETRSELFWSLISVTLNGDATEEEIELLISTFGENLFIRNGVNLRN